jgi:hypothetical protein
MEKIGLKLKNYMIKNSIRIINNSTTTSNRDAGSFRTKAISQDSSLKWDY